MTSLEVEEVESALALLDDYIKKEADVKERTYPPVIKAIQDQEEDVALFLETSDQHDLEATDDEGNTAVMWAVMKNRPDYLMRLMKNQASPNIGNNEGIFPLHKAVDIGNEQLVEILCQWGADVNLVDGAGQSAAHSAVSCGSISMLITLLKYGINVNITDHKGKTALFLAVRKDDMDMFRLLLENKAEVNIADHKGKTALFLAVWKNRTDMLRLLLENNAKVNTTMEVDLNFHKDANSEFEKVTPAMYAAATGYVRGLELLINFGADPHFGENDHKRSAFFYAVLFNHKPCVDVILRESDLGKTLIKACSKGDVDYVKLLLEFDPDLEVTDKQGETALAKTTKHKDTDLLEILLEAGAPVDPDLPNEDSKSPLMSAAYHGNAEHMKILLDKGASVNRINKNKYTALWFAADNGNLKCLKMLLKARTPPNLASSRGTPLMAAISSGCLECFKVLLDHGSEINYRNDKGECAVTCAVPLFSDEYMKLLIDNNANLHVENREGWSPVMLATSQKRTSVLEILLDNGASVNHADGTGMTALHLAAQKDYITCLELLLSHGPNMNTTMRKSRRSMSWTPLACAIKRRSKRCVLVLLKHGACPSSIPDSVGLRTTMTRSFTPQVVKALHAAGADSDLLPDMVYRGGDIERQLPRWRIRHQQPNYPTNLHDHEHDKSLFNICRLNIREHLLQTRPLNLFTTIPLLPLPNLIKSSLLFDVDLSKI